MAGRKQAFRTGSSSASSRTHRGLTCANCRARKTRCDGRQPTCKTCEIYHDTCRYEKPPPMSQIVAMARRLQDAEKTIATLRAELAAERDKEQATPTPCASQLCVLPKSENRSSTDGSRQPSQDLLFDLSVDGNGKLCYVGPTSAVHNPPDIKSDTSPIQTYDEQEGESTATSNTDATAVASPRPHTRQYPQEHDRQTRRPLRRAPAAPAPVSTTTKAEIRSLLTTKAIESRTLEAFALASAAAQTDIPRAALARLLQIHWVWIAPMFMWVYRPAFMRDMARGEGKYYSPLLLVILCGHAARFEEPPATEVGTALPPSVLGDALISRARLLLGAEIHKPSTIPTVQALLQLSARDWAHGHVSQAWLYSGMAFRMVSDLGLQHSSQRQLLSLGSLNAEDLEIRRRLYWSCYFWDKAMSLYLGRMPALIDLPWDASPELLDDFAEHELWTPLGDCADADAPAYPPQKSHAISCFANTCRLAVILCDIMLQLYSRSRRQWPSAGTGGSCSHVHATDAAAVTDTVDASLLHVRDIRQRLDAWRAATPPHLLCDPDVPDDVRPPPHILTQNMLYYAALILLHRPFYASPIHHAACRQAANHLERLLLLLESTFGFRRITYLMAYCVYTGASVLVQDIKRGDGAAVATIQTFLRALRLGVASCPLVRRSLDIITASLDPHEKYDKNVADVSSSSVSSASSASEEPTVTSLASSGLVDQLMTAVLAPLPNSSASASSLAPLSPPAPSPLDRHYLPAFPYYHTQFNFFDAAGSSCRCVDPNGWNGGGIPDPQNIAGSVPGPTLGGEAYDLSGMDVDAFSLLDGFPENNLDSATAAGWYMPQ